MKKQNKKYVRESYEAKCKKKKIINNKTRKKIKFKKIESNKNLEQTLTKLTNSLPPR